jgi:O-antigen/teichoic acid export membrane protein
VASLVATLRRQAGFAFTFAWVAGARATMLGCSMVASVLIYRELAAGASVGGAELGQAGLFAIAMACVRVLTASIGGAADLTVLRRVPVLRRTDPAAAFAVVRAAFVLRAVAILTVGIVAIVARRWIAGALLHDETQAPLVGLVLAAATGELTLRAVLAVFQATERFDRFVAFEATFQGTRLLAILGLIAVGALQVTTAVGAYAALAFVSAALAASRLPRRELLGRPLVSVAALRDAGHFFGWTLVALAMAAMNERMDLFLLGRFRPVEEVGIYGGILVIALIPDFVGGLLATVLQPRVVRLQHEGALGHFGVRIFLVALPLGVLALAIINSFAEPIVALALGPHYAPGAQAFALVASGAIVWLVLTPVPAALISLSAPRLTTLLTVVQLILLGGGGLLVIPRCGPVGAAAVVAGVRLTLALVIIVLGHGLMRRPGAAGTTG